jgi:hypothetical protein
LQYRTSWIGNTYGGAQNQWVQIDAQAMAVATDGTVYINSPWDEAGRELGVYRDGKVVGLGGTTHGWGNGGGDAIAINRDYVFAGHSIDNEGGGLRKAGVYPAKGLIWYGLTRRLRTDVTHGASFAGGRGNPGGPLANSFLLVDEMPHGTDASIRGLAASDTTLYVADIGANAIDVFDARTMQQTARWPAREPGKLALDAAGGLWAIEGIRTDGQRRIVHYLANGHKTGPGFALPRGVEPVDLAFDASGRLLVADNGPAQQILIMTTGNDALQTVTTLGVRGGILAARAGVPGPLRFNGLTGVASDPRGNVYVSMNGAGPRDFTLGNSVGNGAVIESYAPSGRRNWSVEGLLFVDGADVDPDHPDSVYTGTKHFTLDLSRDVGQDWSYAGFTLDRFRFPYDPMLHLNQGTRGTPMMRRIDGKLFMYLTDMESNYLKIYRFDPARDEIAIPSGFFSRRHLDGRWPPNQPARGEWIWRDGDGKGKFNAGDFAMNDGHDGPDPASWWVDRRGDVWQSGTRGIRRFELRGLDAVGNPVYRFDALRRYDIAAPFDRIKRTQYDAATDTMFIGGYTPQRPYDNYFWKGVGSVLARYDRWSGGKPVLRYTIDLPWSLPPHAASIQSMIVEGDYIFAVEDLDARVHVYSRANGAELGIMTPGPEVGSQSGWVDLPHGITAHRRADGEYLVFVEEDLHGKQIMYRWRPPGGRAVAPASTGSAP